MASATKEPKLRWKCPLCGMFSWSGGSLEERIREFRERRIWLIIAEQISFSQGRGTLQTSYRELRDDEVLTHPAAARIVAYVRERIRELAEAVG